MTAELVALYRTEVDTTQSYRVDVMRSYHYLRITNTHDSYRGSCAPPLSVDNQHARWTTERRHRRLVKTHSAMFAEVTVSGTLGPAYFVWGHTFTIYNNYTKIALVLVTEVYCAAPFQIRLMAVGRLHGSLTQSVPHYSDFVPRSQSQRTS